MALCEVDDPAHVWGQVEAFLRAKTPIEHQSHKLFFGSFMQRRLRALFARYPRRLINSGSFTTRTMLGEEIIERQEILDPNTQLAIGCANRLTLRCLDGRDLSLTITQEESSPLLVDPVRVLTQIQASSPNLLAIYHPMLDQG